MPKKKDDVVIKPNAMIIKTLSTVQYKERKKNKEN